MARMFFFLLGFGLMVIGCTYLVTYGNLFALGFTWQEYFSYVSTRVECLFSILGFLILTITIFWKGGKRHDLYL